MVMENQDGDTREIRLLKNNAVYVPRGYAHRTVNTQALSHLYSSTRLTLMQAMITVQLNRRDTESLFWRKMVFRLL